jgi:hypothetical protein
MKKTLSRILRCTTVWLALWTVLAPAIGTPPSKNVPPTVSLTAPAGGASFNAPATIPLTAVASDPDGSVAKVDFYSGSTLLGTAASAPYAYTWANVPAGSYVLTARATDNLGASATSSPVTVSVEAANVPPLVVLTAPAACAQYDAPMSLTLAADALDPDGRISRVEFFHGTTFIGAATAAPDITYRIPWSGVPGGVYSLTARATDNRGAVTASTPVSVTVRAPNVAPTVSLTAPADGAVFPQGANITLAAAASDPDGTVARVDFYRDAGLLGSSTTAPYSHTWTNAAAGSYVLLAVATDNAGASTASEAVSVTVTANSPPSVTLTAPGTGSTYFAPATINLAASASDSDGSVAKVEFYSGSTLLGTATTAPYTYAWSNVAAGSYTLTARVTDNLGASTASAPVSVTVTANAAPAVALTAPADGATYFAPATIPLGAAASDVDGTVARVDFFAGGDLIGTATSAPYSTSWNNVAVGSYTLTARATDNLGGSAVSAPVTITVNAAPLAITAPRDGAMVADDRVLVRGVLNNPPANAGVTVNGVVAIVDDSGNFYANDVPLNPGATTLSATLTTLEGQSFTRTVSVTSSGPSPVRITVEPTRGLAPLATLFTVSARGATVIQQTRYDYEGNLTVDETFTGPPPPLEVTYLAPGVYLPNIVVTDSTGNLYEKTYAVEVEDEARLDSIFQAIWIAMNNALLAGDKPRALSYLTARAQATYGAVFDALLPDMAGIVGSFSGLQSSLVSSNVAEYAINREVDGVNRIFFIYFLLDADGLWRIDSL